jgi:flagellum-specific peptidoglycan hydrolase FlgJ
VVQPKNKNIMKRVIVILLGILFISFEYRNSQNISVSSEDEKTVHSDIIAEDISYNVNFKQKHPYAKFCEEYRGVAIQHQLDCGIPASIQLAQAIAESGGGLSDIAKRSNNLFGMKYYKELYAGGYYETPSGSRWRKYDNFKGSFEDHAQFLNKFYSHAIGKDWKYWSDNCTGYGGEGYWKHIGMVVEKYELWRYDDLVSDYQKRQRYKL